MMKALAAILVLSVAALGSPAHGQCVRENISFYGTIYSKVYVTVKTPDGRYLSVPVVNGLLPGIDETVDDCGFTTRTYTYNSGVKYTPGSCPTYRDRNAPSTAVTRPAPAAGIRETSDRAPQVRESYERLPQVRVVESRSRIIDDDDDDPPYRAPAPRSEKMYGGSLDDSRKTLDEIKEELKKLKEGWEKSEKRTPPAAVRESPAVKEKEYPVMPVIQQKDSKELQAALEAIQELRNEVKKLQLLTLKYEEEKKQGSSSPGMVRPSELGKKKD